jgi:hypothetical protein
MGGAYVGSIAACLANFNPTPDWFIVNYQFTASMNDGFLGCEPVVNFLSPGGCRATLGGISGGVTFDASGAYPVNALGVTLPTSASDPGPSHGGTGSISLSGTVARPSAAYTANSDPRNILLWRPGEINTISFSWSSLCGAYGGSWSVGIQPLWEKPHNYFKVGDTIDLTGMGWQAPYLVTTALLLGLV